MNPAANVATSSGVAMAIVVILTWLLGMAHIVVPPEVQAALSAIITSISGLTIHSYTKPQPPAAPAAAP